MFDVYCKTLSSKVCKNGLQQQANLLQLLYEANHYAHHFASPLLSVQNWSIETFYDHSWSQNRQVSCGNANLLPSTELLFPGERDDEGCVSCDVAWVSVCKWLRFIVTRWWHPRFRPVFLKSTSERVTGIPLHTSCMRFFFSFSLLSRIRKLVKLPIFDTSDVWRIQRWFNNNL